MSREADKGQKSGLEAGHCRDGSGRAGGKDVELRFLLHFLTRTVFLPRSLLYLVRKRGREGGRQLVTYI